MTHKEFTVWAFQHVGHEDLGSFEDVLLEYGANITYLCGKRESLKDLNPLEPDVMILLGGPMGLYETDKYPYLKDEVDIVKRRIESKKPILGICLGSQIIAKALGAEVYPGNEGQEIGWYPIRLTEEAKKTPLRHLSADRTNMMHWHSDTFDLPFGAVHLASSTLYANQGFSYEDHVLAIQCHPEVTPRKLSIWYEKTAADIDEVPGLTVDMLKKEAEAYGQKLKKQARLFLQDWLISIGILR